MEEHIELLRVRLTEALSKMHNKKRPYLAMERVIDRWYAWRDRVEIAHSSLLIPQPFDKDVMFQIRASNCFNPIFDPRSMIISSI